MSSYLITSREGLYHFEAFNRTFNLLKNGFFFGLTKHRHVWYVFGYEGDNEQERTLPTFNGYIASFHIVFDEQGPVVSDWKTIYRGLDNGTHHIKVYKNKLYAIETYIQTIKVFDINDDYTISLSRSIEMFKSERPIANAHYILQGYGDERHTCQGYKHINALTVHDNLIYLSCPSLRNSITPDGKPSQSLSPHVIEVYDLDFNFLWSFIVHNEIFCHDVVFLGHKLYFCAPPNKLCLFDIVTKQYEVVKTFNVKSMHPRGLSIDNAGTIVTGLRSPNSLVISNVNVPFDVDYVGAPCSPCFIAKLDYENDFNNCMSLLVHPFACQLPANELPFETASIQEMSKCIFAHDWRKYFDNRKNDEYRGANKNMISSIERYTLEEVKQPYEICFDNINNLQTLVNQKIYLSELVVEDEMKTTYTDMMTTFKKFCLEVANKAMIVTGKLYLYPPKSGMGWHTNLEEIYNIDTIRCYIVYTTKDNESFFLYKHPISGLIHAIPDRNGFANIFDLGSPDSPLWHAIYNNSRDTQRLSVGIATHKYRMGALRVLKEIVNDISH